MIDGVLVKFSVLLAADWLLNVSTVDDRPYATLLNGFGQINKVLIPCIGHEVFNVNELDAILAQRAVNQVWFDLIANARARSVDLFGP